MTNTSKLRGRIAEKGYNLSTLSAAVSISRPTLRNKLTNAAEFKASEIERVCDVLEIPKEEMSFYFFSG